METDASDYALGAVLGQCQEDGLIHPLAYHSCQFTSAKINYTTHDKELLAIVDASQKYGQYLIGSPFKIRSDHKNLEYFMTKRLLNRR